MLLDRQRINKWAKWMALALVLAFAISFVALGVGSGSGLNFSALWNRSDSGANAAATGPEAAIAGYEATLASDATDQEALLGIANAYKSLGNPGMEAYYLEQLAPLQPGTGELYMRLARIYMSSEVANYPAAVTALREATNLDNNNADAYLQLGIAERNAGNTSGAVMAWTRYLVLEPQGESAETVKTAISAMVPTTTSPASTTTTAAP